MLANVFFTMKRTELQIIDRFHSTKEIDLGGVDLLQSAILALRGWLSSCCYASCQKLYCIWIPECNAVNVKSKMEDNNLNILKIDNKSNPRYLPVFVFNKNRKYHFFSMLQILCYVHCSTYSTFRNNIIPIDGVKPTSISYSMLITIWYNF